mmetsp:Transcript_12183/g.13402  ORF Transcript_12183/g.13402 Transcript_12183/m.13402 type:complete len:527 (+) Transcript_12183:131-1711(+)
MKVRVAVSIALGMLRVSTTVTARSNEAAAETSNHHRYRHRPWKVNEFPNPQINLKECQSSSTRICDPDSVLDPSTLEALSTRIKSFENDDTLTSSSWCPKSIQNDDAKNKNHMIRKDTPKNNDIQFAMALVKRMDLSFFTGSFEDEEDEAAKVFATSLHNEWGVGNVLDEDQCGVSGGTGILLFIAIEDRAVYISTGSAIGTILTDKRLEKIITSMKPFLRQEQFGDAVDQAIHDMTMYIQKGPADFQELAGDLIRDTLIFFGFFGLICFWNKTVERRKREYAHVESQLSQLDRDRAEALQGRYQCTSCPICLEPFPTASENNNGSEAENATTDRTAIPAQRLGSDGKPLKLLRCGHVFDETCWSEWVTSGTGNVRKCPICNQDVGSTDNATLTNRGETEGDQVAVVRDEVVQNDENDNNNNVLRQRNHRAVAERDDGEQRIMRMFRRERNFRLMRMAARYPDYVRPQQLQRWTDSSYDGSLARDTSFVRNNPTYNSPGHPSSSGSSSGGGSFGGGRSSGGRGGRW